MSTVKLLEQLSQIYNLLQDVNEKQWVISFEFFIEKLKAIDSSDDIVLLKSEILGIYGGMGSFSDLVLYDKQQPLVDENTRLDVYRSNLFELCRRNKGSDN